MPRPSPVFQEPEKAKENTSVKALSALLPIFSALAAILAIRLFLLFAVVGAFILAQAALPDTTYHGMFVLIAYCALTILPLVWLDTRKKG